MRSRETRRAVVFENVSKTYTRAYAPSIRDDALHAVRRLARRPSERTIVRALRDVSFSIERGARFAIMGANGSGKTTALRLMSRVAYPTSGSIRVAGRVGGLIDVGAGLHPDLTGRENIWLYGRILGLRRADIARHFDNIVSFADIGRAIDQPLKQYSSGMMVRVGFSVASFLEPDILVVDEAIAVGDAGFQERCLERMESITDAGATLVFVSHSSPMVTKLCPEGILLHEGRVVEVGPIDRIVGGYLNEVVRTTETDQHAERLTVRSWDYAFTPGTGRNLGELTIRVDLDAPEPIEDLRLVVDVGHSKRGSLLRCSMELDGFSLGRVNGPVAVACTIKELPLEAGQYEIWAAAVDGRDGKVILKGRRLGFAVFGHNRGDRPASTGPDAGKPLLQAPYAWHIDAVGPLTPSTPERDHEVVS